MKIFIVAVFLAFYHFRNWQLQEAKNRFSEVVRKASDEGPQTVTKYGKDSVVVLSAEDYRKLKKPKTSLVEFFKNLPFQTLSWILREINHLPAPSNYELFD